MLTIEVPAVRYQDATVAKQDYQTSTEQKKCDSKQQQEQQQRGN